jgi:serine/threonine protein kinase
MRLAHTAARLGKWKIENEKGEIFRADHWADLKHMEGGRVVQEEIGETLAPIITLEKELGAGSFGRVFACKIQMPDGSVEGHVVKVPGKLMDAGVLYVDSETNELVVQNNNTEKEQMKNQLAVEFQREFESFEKIYEPRSFWMKHKGGLRGENIDTDDFQSMQAEMRKLNMEPGRKHIHEYLHFDGNIPAIVSSLCDDTLENIRSKNLEWFRVTAHHGVVQPSHTWVRVATELANAVEYITKQGFVHTDIKPANVLVVVSGKGPSGFTCKLSDFGEVMADQTTDSIKTGYTPFFTPQNWPVQPVARMEPVTLAVYGFAATAAALMDIPQTREWPLYVGQFFDQDLAYMRERHPFGNVLFPAINDRDFVTGEYAQRNKKWFYIAAILNLNYAMERCNRRTDLLSGFLDASADFRNKQ